MRTSNFLQTLKRPFQPGKKPRGQSLVELAIFLPILLMILGGLVEFGFAFNEYINVVEATREGARAGVDGDPAQRDLDTNGRSKTNCEDIRDGSGNLVSAATTDYYARIVCVIENAMEPVSLDPATSYDDIVITVVRVYRDPVCDETPAPTFTPTANPNPWPARCNPPTGVDILPDPLGLWPYTPAPPSAGSPGSNNAPGQWILYGNSVSRFNRTRLENYVDTNPIPTGAGILVVETYYTFNLVLKLPWIQPFIDIEDDGIPFYTYTIVPLPAGEPRATPTQTPTPTNTPTNTPTPTVVPPTNTFTPTPSDTPTQTATPTETPAPTATSPCNLGIVSAARSRVIVSEPNPAWSDNEMLVPVQVQLYDDCNVPVQAADEVPPRPVTLFSSRGAADVITAGPATGNTYFFDVRSGTVGTSILQASVPITPSGTVISFPLSPSAENTVDFVCVAGVQDVSTNPNTLQLLYTNPSEPAANRRIITLNVTWNSGRQLNSVSFGNSANVIWNGPPASSPLNIPSTGWSSTNRVVTSTQFKPLQLNFNGPIRPTSGTWTYTVVASWDNGAGGSICTSAPVVVSLTP